jgi:DNA polymerase III epsilon subunit-like protein
VISIIDFETTGLIKEGSQDFLAQPGITQIGLVTLGEDLSEIGAIDQIINPDIASGAWSEEAIKVTGIGPEQVKDAPSFLGFFDKFADAVRGGLYWGGYNTKFDRDVLWFQLLRYGLEKNFPWPPREFDMMKLVSNKLGYVPGKRHNRWKLTDAYEHVFKKSFDDAHSGIADVRAVADLMREWRDDISF